MPPKAIKHFEINDNILFGLASIHSSKIIQLKDSCNYFSDLCDQIISQQLSSKIADIIFSRFKLLFKNYEISAEQVLKINIENFREAGLSYSKIKYIKSLAEYVVNEEIILEDLKYKTDEDVIIELTKIKGIGRWTAEMFLIFSLGRENVFSFGDFGLKTAVKKHYNTESKDEIEKIVSNWNPYKTYASLILWKSLNNK